MALGISHSSLKDRLDLYHHFQLSQARLGIPASLGAKIPKGPLLPVIFSIPTNSQSYPVLLQKKKR